MNTKLSEPASDDPNRLVDEREAASRLGVKPATLSVWRCTRRYPLPYVKMGALVRYRVSDLDGFIQSRTKGDAGGDL